MKEEKKITRKSIFRGFTLGVTIGIFTSLFINILLEVENFSVALPSLSEKLGSNFATFVNLLLFGLIGIISNLSSKVFENDRRSLLLNTMIHYLLIQLTLIVLGFLLGWMTYYFIYVLPIATFIYLIIWGSIYYSTKKDIKKMNLKLKGLNN